MNDCGLLRLLLLGLLLGLLLLLLLLLLLWWDMMGWKVLWRLLRMGL